MTHLPQQPTPRPIVRPSAPPPPGLSAGVFEDVYLGVATATAAALLLFICLAPITYGLLPRSFWLPIILGIAAVSFVVGSLTGYGAACRRRDWIRAREGQCLRCGYDLRASTDRCPECGRRLRRGETPEPRSRGT